MKVVFFYLLLLFNMLFIFSFFSSWCCCKWLLVCRFLGHIRVFILFSVCSHCEHFSNDEEYRKGQTRNEKRTDRCRLEYPNMCTVTPAWRRLIFSSIFNVKPLVLDALHLTIEDVNLKSIIRSIFILRDLLFLTRKSISRLRIWSKCFFISMSFGKNVHLNPKHVSLACRHYFSIKWPIRRLRNDRSLRRFVVGLSQ